MPLLIKFVFIKSLFLTFSFEFFAVGSGDGSLVTYDATKLTQRNTFTLDVFIFPFLNF